MKRKNYKFTIFVIVFVFTNIFSVLVNSQSYSNEGVKIYDHNVQPHVMDYTNKDLFIIYKNKIYSYASVWNGRGFNLATQHWSFGNSSVGTNIRQITSQTYLRTDQHTSTLNNPKNLSNNAYYEQSLIDRRVYFYYGSNFKEIIIYIKLYNRICNSYEGYDQFGNRTQVELWYGGSGISSNTILILNKSSYANPYYSDENYVLFSGSTPWVANTFDLRKNIEIGYTLGYVIDSIDPAKTNAFITWQIFGFNRNGTHFNLTKTYILFSTYERSTYLKDQYLFFITYANYGSGMTIMDYPSFRENTLIYERFAGIQSFGNLSYITPIFPSIYNSLSEQRLIVFDNRANWSYNSFSLDSNENRSISLQRNYDQFNESSNETEIKSYSYESNYSIMFVKSETGFFFYTEQTIKPSDWGNWEIRWFQGTAIEAVLNFNWLRDLFVNTINAIMFIMQGLLFLLVAGLQYVYFIVLIIVVLLWNYPIFWIYFGVIGIVFYISFFFVWLWNQAVILWKLIVEPFFDWLWNYILMNIINPLIEFFRNGGLKILFDFYMIILSYVIATLLWIFTFGTIDFSTIQQSIQTMLLSINSSIFEFVSVFLANFALILAASATYILLIGLIYIKYVYAKSRGYVQRAARLQSMINVYKLPLVLVVRMVSYFIGFFQGGVPTDGTVDK